MKFSSFEEILVWQKSKSFCIEIYSALKLCKDYSFKDQIQRAAVSTSNNIAEGYERKGNKEFRKFLYIAKGSSAEVRSMLSLAVDLGYISESDYKKLLVKSCEIARMLSGLIKTL